MSLLTENCACFLVWISIWARNLVSATSYLCCNILYLHILPRLAVSSNANCHHQVPCDGTESVFHMNIMICPPPPAERTCLVGFMIRVAHTEPFASSKDVRFLRGIHKFSYSVYVYTASHTNIPDSRICSHFHHC